MKLARAGRLLVLLTALSTLGLTACGDDSDRGDATATTEAGVATTLAGTTGTEGGVRGDVMVFAAASLTESFTRLGEDFEAANPDATVTFNFAASSALVQQVNEGAPADVFASADQANMKKLSDAGDNGSEPEVFAENSLEIIVAPGNPGNITGLADLARPDVLWVTCAPEVPIGAYSAQALDKAGVTATPASYEENVKSVVTKVTAGEADAGIVYATDVTAAGARAEGVEIPVEFNVLAQYPIATIEAAPNPDGAEAFVDFILSENGQKVLATFGFSNP